MKKISYLTLAGLAWLAWLATPLARAWTYQDGDVLLIFRESGFNDVEFDIGGISQFLNQSSGYTAPVTGWDLGLVTNVFGSDLTGVSIILAATTSRTNAVRSTWLTSSESVTSVGDVTASAWQSELWSIINSIGTRPVIYLVPPTNAAYVIDPGGTYRLASYDYIVTGGGVNGNSISEFGGNAAFNVEGIIPGTVGFWQIQPTNAIPKPAATYVGSFSIDASGNLNFVAGAPQAPQPTIVGFGRSGNVSTVSFTTVASGNYTLVYTNTLGAAIGTWPAVSGPIAGDGSTQSLTHTNSVDSAGFYGVLRSP
ncbi:MAG: hypothetical protein ABSH38_17990 [Verrucomicrobiota bacterium]|jgi:hypothetical protein